jgi:hypothetical protein
MTTYLFAYRMPNDYAPGGTDARAAWSAWFDGLGADVVTRGNPVFEATALGNCGPDTHVGGYSLITADDLDAAVAMAKDCPALEGGGVEVGPITPLTDD